MICQVGASRELREMDARVNVDAWAFFVMLLMTSQPHASDELMLRPDSDVLVVSQDKGVGEVVVA